MLQPARDKLFKEVGRTKARTDGEKGAKQGDGGITLEFNNHGKHDGQQAEDGSPGGSQGYQSCSYCNIK